MPPRNANVCRPSLEAYSGQLQFSRLDTILIFNDFLREGGIRESFRNAVGG